MLFIIFTLVWANNVKAPIWTFEFIQSESDVSEENLLENVPEKTTSIIFGGDVMLSRVVGQKMVKYNDFSWPLKDVSPTMLSADISVINLESPFTIGLKSYTVPTGSFSFNADPKSILALKTAGVDLVSLANNHFGNQGKKGMQDTFTLLNENNITYVGAGLDSDEAHSYKELYANDSKFCFLGYAYPSDLYVSGISSPGIASMDQDVMAKNVQTARASCDSVIVMMHAGIEYVNKPNMQQKNFARAAIDAGADLVIGHHPHWVQVTEIYQGKPILYSLGNLVFDQMWSRETAQGALAKVVYKGNTIKEIEIIPIEIVDYGKAVLAGESVSKEIINRMELSDRFIKINQ